MEKRSTSISRQDGSNWTTSMAHDNMNEDRRQALRIAFAYAAAGYVCTVLSDWRFAEIALRDLPWALELDLLNNAVFVTLTTVLLYFFVQQHLRRTSGAGAALAESEERLKLTMEAISDGVWDWNMASDRAYLSPRYYEITGFRAGEVVPDLDFFTSLVHPDDRELVLGTLHDHLSGNVPQSFFEFRMITRDGTVKWILGRGKVVERDAQGKALRMLGTISDISDRKAMEQQLQQSERRYRAVVEDQTEVICRFLPDGTLTFVNDVYCRFFGKTSQELVGRTWHPRAHADDLPQITERLQSMSAQHPVVVVENRVHSATAGLRWMQFVNRGFYDQQGRLLETQSVGRDITELKMTGEAKKRGEQQLKLIIDSIPACVSYIDKQYRYSWANLGYEQWFQCGRDQICGRTVRELLGEAAWSSVRPHLEQAFAGQSVAFETVVPGSSVRKTLSVAYTPDCDQNGTVTGVIAMVMDISERLNSQEALRNYARRLIELEEELRQKLAAELHDEICRELTALGLTIAMVHDHLPGQVRQQLSPRLEDAGVMLETISGTVRGMMAKLRPPVLDDYGLPAALSWHCDLFSKRSGLLIELCLQDGFPRLPIDLELALFRIVQEALANVSRHAAARTVRVLLTREGAAMRLSVSDDGAGFDLALALRKKEKSHWGLTMMRERAEAVGGRLHVDTRPGGGTTVQVELEQGG